MHKYIQYILIINLIVDSTQRGVHEKYLGKIPCDNVDALPKDQRHLYIDSKEDNRLRAEAVRNNPDIVDMWFVNRIEKMLKHVFGDTLRVEDYIVRYEAQHRGTGTQFNRKSFD